MFITLLVLTLATLLAAIADITLTWLRPDGADAQPVTPPTPEPEPWLPGDLPVFPTGAGVWTYADVSHDDARMLRAEDAERAMGLR